MPAAAVDAAVAADEDGLNHLDLGAKADGSCTGCAVAC
jgi:hypothetical protein